MHEAFLEQLYRWLEPLADWLLASSRMEWLTRVVERLHMAEGLMLALMLALGAGLGFVFIVACYMSELGRQTRFLARRERESNARLTCGSRLPGMVGMVDAVNAEIDAADAERVRALRAADEFSSSPGKGSFGKFPFPILQQSFLALPKSDARTKREDILCLILPMPPRYSTPSQILILLPLAAVSLFPAQSKTKRQRLLSPQKAKLTQIFFPRPLSKSATS